MTVFEDQDVFDSAEATDSAPKDSSIEVCVCSVGVCSVGDVGIGSDRGLLRLTEFIQIDMDEHGADAGPIDYNLYRTFWDLQRYFREHELAIQSAENWEKFVRLHTLVKQPLSLSTHAHTLLCWFYVCGPV